MPNKDTKPYQMKRRRYGWGWTPVTVRSISFIIAQIAIIFTAASFLVFSPTEPSIGQVAAFLIIVALVVATMILYSLDSAPKPAWRWGKKPSDNPDEDF